MIKVNQLFVVAEIIGFLYQTNQIRCRLDGHWLSIVIRLSVLGSQLFYVKAPTFSVTLVSSQY